jgi:hypothetical protein
MSHKFKLQQRVKVSGLFVTAKNPNVDYQVTRLMPADDSGRTSYRVTGGGVERAVFEFQIEAVA